MLPNLPDLPVLAVIERLREALAGGHAVLEAPTGSGKTTLVPLALTGCAPFSGRRIVVTEPRRVAARAAARRMAALLGEPVGRTVGYRTRLDTRTGPATRIEVVTEGVLVRMLQSDPGLDGVGLVIVDEFHERSVQVDLALAMLLDVCDALRDDLRLLVMSATLDTPTIGAFLGDAPVVSCTGRSWPVRIVYRPPHRDVRLETAVTRAVTSALADADGDVLVFVPGVGEIRRIGALLAAACPVGVELLPLHGMLGDADQDKVFERPREGRRRLILATPIAETSLTIDGIRTVVDSGLHRAPRFSPATGLTRLDTVPISRAAADQRSGRAGRTGPGRAIRLWSEAEHARRPAGYPAAIVDADLAGLRLELAAWGTADPLSMRWLDPPPAAAMAQAHDLLIALEATDPDGRISDHGREMAKLGLHPRLAHLLLRAHAAGHGVLACDIAALVSDRDPLRFEPGHDDADIALRLQALRDARTALPRGATVSGATLRRIRRTASDLRRRLGLDDRRDDAQNPGRLVALAWPERVGARRHPDGLAYRLAGGRGATLKNRQPLAGEPYLAVASLDSRRGDGRIHLAAALARGEIEALFEQRIVASQDVCWDPDSQAVVARTTRRFGRLELDSTPLEKPDPDRVTTALLDGIRQAGLSMLPWTDKASGLRARIAWLRAAGIAPELAWPAMDDESLLATLDDWLAPFVAGVTRAAQLARVDLAGALAAGLDARAAAALDRLAPPRVSVPSGSRLRIDYDVDPTVGETPVLAVKLQEMFGSSQTPTVADGRIPLTLHLLSPAGRPAQITRDLGGFWSRGYDQVRRELRGRYPKHRWPDDPAAAEPTRRTTRRRR